MEWEEFSKEVQDAVIEISDVRRPYKFYRGKTLTHEQLVELFVHEEPILKGWGPDGEDLLEKKGCWYDVRGYYGMIGCCLHRKSFRWLTSMVMSDGTIYGSALECKYPDWEEYLPDWAQFAKRNPFVDMIVAYTNNDESPCYWCDLVHYCEENRMISCEWHEDGFCLAKQNKEYADKCYEYNKRFWNSIGSEHKVPEEERNYLYDFYESADQYLMPFDAHKSVKLVVHIHDGRIDLLAGEEAQRKFCEYDELYGDFRMMIVNHSYFFEPQCGKNGVPARILFDDAFMRECFAKIGCETVWDEVAKPKYLQEIDKDAIVVTKEWLCEEYDKAFAGTELDIKNMEKLQKKYREELRCIK